MIKFHARLELQTLIVFLMGTITTNVYIIVVYAVLGEINAASKKLIISTLRKSERNTREDIAFIKFLKSSKQYLGVHLSSFGVYTKPGSLKIIGKIIIYTVKSLMMTKRLG